MTDETTPVVVLDHITKTFRMGGMFSRKKHVAVDDVSLTVQPREVLGLVGESGSGKSTIGRMAVSLITPTSGSVQVLGQDLASLKGAELARFRRRMQMVFQDSSNSLNPRMTLRELLMEPYVVQGLYGQTERETRVRALADEVQLAHAWLDRLPHQFSGGQRQRISIARALALEPDVIVADEPVSALDVSVQARILNLLKDVQERRGLSMIFISHDMAVVEFMCDRTAVLLDGKVVDHGPSERVFSEPGDDYTRTLLAASPSL